mmetsp:Transcript_13990/g.32772  ORF Transcript_13990/g.32772 Transcript_13990/m.32772 type:complete len:346 (+) Transcript_13990:481-1518(+)
MASAIVVRISFSMAGLEHNTRDIDIAIPQQNSSPSFHAALVLDQAMVFEAKYRTQFDTEQLHHIAEDFESRLDLGRNILISLTLECTARDHALLFVYRSLLAVVLLAHALRQPFVILCAGQLDGLDAGQCGTQGIKVRLIFRLGESVVHVVLLGIREDLGVSMPLGRVSRDLHLKILVSVRFNLLEALPECGNFGIRRILQVTVREVLGHKPIIPRLLVDNVRVWRVQYRPFIDRVAVPKLRVIADLVPLFVQRNFCNVFILRIEIVGVLITRIRIPFIVELISEVPFVPLAERCCVDGIVVVVITHQVFLGAIVLEQLRIFFREFSETAINFVEYSVPFVCLCF